MEVHAPDHPIHTWRDFLIHIATITIGLLIALGLEAAVEALHHRHLRAETRENLRAEIAANQQDFPRDLKALDGEVKELNNNLSLLHRLRSHAKAAPGERIRFDWFWSGPSDAAWQTAKTTGVLSLMENQAVGDFDSVYSQQKLVDDAAIQLSRDMTRAEIPLAIEPDLNALTPSLIDELIRDCAMNLNQIEYVRTLAAPLMPGYKDALAKL